MGENRLAHERNEAGDERFFDFLQTDLADPGEEAKERLAIYYVSALGLYGCIRPKPIRFCRYAEQIFPRISEWLDRVPRTKISEGADRYTDTRVLTQSAEQQDRVGGHLVSVFVS